MMSVNASIVTTTDETSRREAVETAKAAISSHKTVVIPTDTVYGIAADAFSIEGVSALLAAKGRSRQMPPPVLIFNESVLAGLADDVSEDAAALAAEFWPGALTLIFYAQPSLNWDLGETQGTVALRVPDDPTAIELLRHLGPLAVSSANKTGRPAATTAEEAMEQLGNDVEVIFDGGPRPLERGEGFDAASVLPSTIVDCTSDRLVIVREGAISVERLREVVPNLMTRAEVEAQDQAVREAQAAATETQVAMDHADYHALEPADAEPLARRAPAPESGTVVAGLVGASGVAGIDQRRVPHAQTPETKVVRDSTKPYPVDVARNIVFGATQGAAEVLSTSEPELPESTSPEGTEAEEQVG